MSMISSSFESVAKKVAGADTLVAHRIGAGRIAFITHTSNKVKKLTLDQIKLIISGQVRNWFELGGDDKPIVIISEYAGGGIRLTVEKELLNETSFSGDVKGLPNGTQIVKVVSQIPDAFGIASAATLTDSVSLIETDKEIEQPLSLVTKGEISPSVKKLIDAIKALDIN